MLRNHLHTVCTAASGQCGELLSSSLPALVDKTLHNQTENSLWFNVLSDASLLINRPKACMHTSAA